MTYTSYQGLPSGRELRETTSSPTQKNYYSRQISPRESSKGNLQRRDQLLSLFLDSQLVAAGLGTHFQLALQKGLTLREALLSLPKDQRITLKNHLGPKKLSAIVSLSKEIDPRLFFSDLTSLARRWAGQGNEGVGATLLGLTLRAMVEIKELSDLCPKDLRDRMQRELEAIGGKGALGPRLEYEVSRFIKQATHPISLAGFGIAAGTFQITRCTLLSRLLASPIKNSLGGVLGARLLAVTGGVLAESVALSMSTRGLYQLAGYSLDWSAEGVGKDILSAGITLGFLRTSGFLAKGAFNGIHGIKPYSPTPFSIRLSGITRLSETLLPQTAMFGGIVLAHKTESQLGLRPEVSSGTLLINTLLTWFHFNVAGALFNRIQPQSFRHWTYSMEFRSEQLTRLSFQKWREGLHWHPWDNNGSGKLVLAEGPAGLVRGKSPHSKLISRERSSLKELPLFMAKRRSTTSKPPPKKGNQTRASIEAAVAEFSPLLEEHPVPTLITDPKGEIVYLNRAASQLLSLGIQTQILTGRRLSDLLTPKDGTRELFHPNQKEGADMALVKVTRPFPGNKALTLNYLQDVTVAQSLQRHVEECGTCPNRQLAAVTQLLRMSFHDARNLLAVIKGYQDMVQPKVWGVYEEHGRIPGEEALFESDRDFALQSKRAMEQTFELFTTASNLLKGKEITRSVFDLSREIQSATAHFLFFQNMQKKGVKLVANPRPRILFLGNPILIRISLVNLLKNAFEATPEGGTVTVKVTEKGETTQIDISDTGSGISPANLERIWTPDFTTKSTGQGMGLAMVKKVIEEIHGGEISVESKVGEGTTFSIILPNELAH